MLSSPTPGIGGEAARSESKQGGPEGLRAFLHDAFRGGAELRHVRRSERPPLRSQRSGPDCTHGGRTARQRTEQNHAGRTPRQRPEQNGVGCFMRRDRW